MASQDPLLCFENVNDNSCSSWSLQYLVKYEGVTTFFRKSIYLNNISFSLYMADYLFSILNAVIQTFDTKRQTRCSLIGESVVKLEPKPNPKHPEQW